MSEKGLVAGFLSTIVALIFGEAIGGLGIWSAIADAALTPAGGWLVLLAIGVGLGYLYSYFGFDKLFGKEAVVKGAAYGMLIWIVTLILAAIFPTLGNAAFAEPIRAKLFLQALTHLVWGATLGLTYQSR